MIDESFLIENNINNYLCLNITPKEEVDYFNKNANMFKRYYPDIYHIGLTFETSHADKEYIIRKCKQHKTIIIIRLEELLLAKDEYMFNWLGSNDDRDYMKNKDIDQIEFLWGNYLRKMDKYVSVEKLENSYG